MKKLVLFLGALCCLLSVQADVLTVQEAVKYADGMAQALVTNFWGASFTDHPRRYFFNKMSQQADLGTEDYWPQAHAIDVVTDVFQRTQDKKYGELYGLWWQGMPWFNPGARQGRRRGDRWWNAYVDDMEWHCLALIRIFETTGETRYLNKARQLYADWIWTEWSPEDEEPWHGGITWKTDVAKSKNACSNGPAAIIAARLAQFAAVDAANGKNKSAAEYQEQALKIYRWERKVLWNEKSGAILDNINQEGKVARFSLSYNQGTFIGAAVELFKLTKDRSLLDDAILTARFTTGPLSRRNNGVLPDAPGGDGGLFHGIFFRYLANLIVLPDVDEAVRKELTDYLLHSATVMVREGVNPQTMLYAGRWRQPAPADEPSSLNAHVTGCMLLEAACKVMGQTKFVPPPVRQSVTHASIPPVPRKLWSPAAKQGKIETFDYTVTRGGETWTKQARVYVPAGYDAADGHRRYNVLYLIHGGGDNEKSFLEPPAGWLRLRDLLDHMIADGEIEPVLVVTPTFYDGDAKKGGNSFQRATELTMNFNQELRTALIPRVESAYNTYYKDLAAATPDDVNGAIDKTRAHRAFGGFSMGALCTWYQLIRDCAAVKYYIPLSGDIWHFGPDAQRTDFVQTAKWVNEELEKSPYRNDFKVFGYTGTDDIAGTPQRQIVEALAAHAPVFRYGTADANLFFALREKGKHFYGDVNQYLYFALPRLWK